MVDKYIEDGDMEDLEKIQLRALSFYDEYTWLECTECENDFFMPTGGGACPYCGSVKWTENLR